MAHFAEAARRLCCAEPALRAAQLFQHGGGFEPGRRSEVEALPLIFSVRRIHKSVPGPILQIFRRIAWSALLEYTVASVPSQMKESASGLFSSAHSDASSRAVIVSAPGFRGGNHGRAVP
jgi:hypothetical protein